MLRLRCFSFEIESPYWAVVLLFIVVSIFSALGIWQASRYIERTHQMKEWLHLQTLPPATLSNDIEQQLNHRVTLEGYFLSTYPLLLDNQLSQGRPGYHVLMPVQLSPDKPWLLIDRGWIPLGATREILPQIAPISESVLLTGTLKKPMYNRLISSTTDVEEVSWPLRIQNVAMSWIADVLPHPLYPLVLDLDAQSPYAFTKNSQTPWLTPMRHQVYALQWFSFVILAISFWLRFSIRRRNKK